MEEMSRSCFASGFDETDEIQESNWSRKLGQHLMEPNTRNVLRKALETNPINRARRGALCAETLYPDDFDAYGAAGTAAPRNI
jgi:hypothetical protein